MPSLPSPIVRKTEPLAEEYLPTELVGRSRELLELRTPIDSLRASGPRVFWLHGPSGSGKTSMARAVLAIAEDRRIRTAYVNCWSAQTFYAVLESIFSELRALVGEVRDVAFKLERLVQLARRHHLAIVLDELDQMPPKERNATLYNIVRLPHVVLLCLAQSRDAYVALDARVQSRVQPVFLQLQPFSVEQLATILEARADQSLLPESFCVADLQRISSASNGDARVAIQALRTAAYLAEKSRSPQIRIEDIESGLQKSVELRRHYVIRGLSEQHRLIYRLIFEAGGPLSTTEAWRRYIAAAQDNKLDVMKRRTFNHYKQFLVTSRLLRERQSRGRLNTRVLEIVS